MTSLPIGYGVKVCPGCHQKNCVPPDLVAELKSLGIEKPVGSLDDPRLRYPEMLIHDGWKREETESGIRYQKSGQDCSQSIDFGEDRWRRITTRLPERTQVVQMTLEGRVQQWVESGQVPQLDAKVGRARSHFESFEETGELYVPNYQRSLTPAEVDGYKTDLEDTLAQLRGLDESEADRARPFPGEVNTEQTQARFWQTPCGWQLSRLEEDTVSVSRSNGRQVWAVSSEPGGQVTALYLDLAEPAKSYEQVGQPVPEPPCHWEDY